MGVLVFVLGRTGTGKSYSMRNFPKDKLAVVNIQGKILPFRGSAEIEQKNTDGSDEVLSTLKKYAKDYKSIVVDDFQYLMANEFMRRAYEKGWDKFTEIARHAWDIADKVRELPGDVIVYVMCHTDTDSEGVERLKTIGRLLDEKIFLEGMSTIVLKTHVTEGKYVFLTQNSGKDTTKSPADMFPGYAIDNDLYYVDQKIREYYGLGATMSADDLAEADKDVIVKEEKPDKKKRNSRSNAAEEEPKKTRRRRSEDPAIQATKKENSEVIANAGITDDNDGEQGTLFEDVDVPELKEEPKRKRRKKPEAENTDADVVTDVVSDDTESDTKNDTENDVKDEVETKPRRRRRRSA